MVDISTSLQRRSWPIGTAQAGGSSSSRLGWRLIGIAYRATMLPLLLRTVVALLWKADRS